MEIFPSQYRAAGQSLGSATHQVFAALLTTFSPTMVSAFAPGAFAPGAFAPGCVFLFLCGMMVLPLIWLKTMVPETKGVPLEGIPKQLAIEA